MKFKIRYADQIVGFLVVVALVSLAAIIFLLGSKQRWFSRDFYYRTYAASASGLKENMPVLLRGIQIGNVKSFRLMDDDRVEVIFTIYDSYNNRVKTGSLIQILVSPIGLGNQFLFHPGLGNSLHAENDLVPSSSSREGRELITRGLGLIPSQNDTIAILMTKVNTVLDGVNQTLEEVNRAMAGDQTSVLGRTLNSVEETISMLPGELEQIEDITKDISLVTKDLSAISARLASPDGVMSLLDGDGAVITGLESSMTSVSAALANLEKTTAYLPREMPRIINLLDEVRTTLKTAQEVLIALRNNPLLRNGIPEHMETDTSGTNPRDISF